MIPKVIHYCWFGGGPLPDSAKACIESWKKFCPDYEIRRWDEKNFDLHVCRYVCEAYERKKWAFVSDYVRFAVLYRNGGIYFDTDVELIRNIDDIVVRGPFFGLEPPSPYEAGNRPRIAPGLGMGAEAGNPFCRKVLDSYEKDTYIRADGTANPITVNTRVGRLIDEFDEEIGKSKEVAPDKKASGTEEADQAVKKDKIEKKAGFWLYPPEYFCPVNYYTGEISITKKTRSIHHYDAAWKNEDEKAIARIRQKFALKGQPGHLEAAVLTAPLRIRNRVREGGWKNAGKRAAAAVKKQITDGIAQRSQRLEERYNAPVIQKTIKGGEKKIAQRTEGQGAADNKDNEIEITILTPAYNRADSLGPLFESLTVQGTKNFEWLIVDDGSTDDTKECVTRFQKKAAAEGDFPIRYLYQKNGGKHRAVNRGVKAAAGDYIFIVDSDDYLLPDAMKYVTKWCGEIRDLPKVAGVAGRRVSPDQKEILGYKKTGRSGLAKENTGTYVTAPNNQRKKYHLSGDQAEIYKTSILKRFPFREFPGENFLSEDSVWNLIAGKGYVLRWYDQPIYVCDYREDGLSAKVRNEQLEWKNFEGFSYRLTVNWRYAPNPARKVMRLVRFYRTQREKGYTLAEARYRLAKFCRMMDQQR